MREGPAYRFRGANQAGAAKMQSDLLLSWTGLFLSLAFVTVVLFA